MTELRDEKARTSVTPDLDDAKLLGFQCLGQDEEARPEQAIGVAFNKRGMEVPPPTSPPAN